MSQVFKNGARTELDTAITASTTQFSVIDGTIFPEANASVTGGVINQTSGDWFKLVLQDGFGNFEVVYCYGHEEMSHSFTVLRGQEGTTARDFSEGTTVGLRLLSSDLDTIHSTLILLAETKQEKSVPAAKADSLTAARQISLTGAVQANATWDASGALELVTDSIDISKASAGTLPVGRGGTGKTSHTTGQVLVGNGTGAVTSLAIDTTTSGTASSGSLITSGAVNAGLALKANLASPAFTGTPTAPTQAAGNNTTRLATTAFVTTAVSNAVSTLLGSAPSEALDTLKELGDALGNDPDFAATVTNSLATKVDKVAGKGLSTNDFTTALLNKLNGVAEGANNFSLPAGTNGQVLKHNGSTWVAGTDNNTTYSVLSAANANAGTATTGELITAAVLKSAINTHAPAQTTITGNAGSATKLATARTINGVSFDGTANITVEDSTKLPLSGGTLTGPLTGKAISGELAHSSGYFLIKPYNATYDDGSTMRAYWDGNSGNLVFSRAGGTGLAGVRLQANLIGNADTSSSSAKLTTSRSLTIGSTAKNFDGSANVAWTIAEILPTGTNGQVLKHNGTTWVAGTDNNTTYSTMSASEANTGTATTARVITAAVLKEAINTHAPTPTNVSGNAGTATKLANARTINGVSFDGTANITITAAANGGTSAACSGNAATATTLATARTINGTAFNGSANITTANWGTSRSINIGGVTKSVNGSANVTWTAEEIGGVRSFTSVPTTNQGPEIIVTSPHLRVMVWNGTKYVRAPWHAPGQLSYFLRNIPTGYVEVRSDVTLKKADFPDLAEYLGVTGTTFVLDEARGEFIRSLDSGRGKDSGRVVGSQQGDAGRNLTGAWYPSNENSGAALGSIGTYGGVIAPTGYAAVARVLQDGNLPEGSPFGFSIDASLQWPVAAEFRVSNLAYRLAVTY